MKKQLLGSTMIVAAGLLAAGPVFAAEKPTVSFSGFTRVEVSFSDQDLNAGRERGYHIETDENYLNWAAKGTTDNGITYAATAKMEFNKGGSLGADEAYLSFGGDWGSVVMGDDDGADDIMMIGGYSLLTAGFGYDGGYGSQVNFSSKDGGAHAFASLTGDTGDATKVSYYTPRWNGLQLGASWTPDSGHSFDAGIGGEPDNDGDLENAVGFGINYKQKHGEVGVKFGATIGIGSYEDTVVKAATYATDGAGNKLDGKGNRDPVALTKGVPAKSGADREDVSAWSIGGNISYTGVSFGAGYGNNGESGCATAETLCDAGEWWDVSAQYKFGSTTIASGYFNSTGNPGGGVSDTEIGVWTLGVSHNLAMAPGLRVYGEVTNYSIDREGTDKDNDANYVMIGTNLSF